MEINFPQLHQLLDQNEALRAEIREMKAKIDTLVLAVESPGREQLDPPVEDKPKPAAKATKLSKAKPAAPIEANGEDHEDQDDEETLRARVSFEGKRVSRSFGIGAVRASIKKVTGENILQVDDVPASQLLAPLTELRAL
jgi:hypothetical protein